MLFELISLSDRRRAQAEGEAAGGRRRSGRRRRDARRAGGAAQVSRHPARSGGLHRGARSAAAAGLFDLVVAQVRARPGLADRRCGALRHRRAHAARRLLDLPRRARRARRQDQGLCAEGAALRAAGRSVEADHHDRSGHRHRAVSRLPARAAGDQGARAATGCSSAISASDFDFFYEDELVGDARGRTADAADARLVARRQRENLRAAPHARGRPRSVVVARRRRACLCLRRRVAHGQGCRSRARSTSSPNTAAARRPRR